MIKTLVIDVDGILTDGTFSYDLNGDKSHKVFGADDNDALKLLSCEVNIVFVSADSRGFAISQSRVRDMGHAIYCVSSSDRLEWIKSRYDLEATCYIGDGFYDSRILTRCGYSVSTYSSSLAAKLTASFVTPSVGGQRALSEAVLHLCIRFFPHVFEYYCKLCNLNEAQSSQLRYYLNPFDIADLSRIYVSKINDRDLDGVLKMLSSDCTVTEPGKSFCDQSSIRSLYADLCETEDLKISILKLATSESSVMMHLLVNSVLGEVDVIDILDFNPDGLVKGIRAFF